MPISFQSALAASGIGPGSSGLNPGVSGHLTFQHGGEKAVIAKSGGAGNVTPTLTTSNKVYKNLTLQNGESDFIYL